MRDISLLEQKKLQWAKEKEELSKLNDFFAATTTTHQFERTSIRTYYSNVDLSSSTNSSIKSSTMPRRANYYYEPYDDSNDCHKNMRSKKNDPRNSGYRMYAVDSCCDNDFPYETNDSHDLSHNTIRAPMLPPIGRNRQKQMSTQTRNNRFAQQNTDEETSGYLSDRMSPWANDTRHKAQHQFNQQQGFLKDYSNYIYPSSGDELAPEVDALKIDNRRRIPKHNPPNCEAHENGHETDFTIPKTPSSMNSDNQNYSRLSSCPLNRKDKEERAKWGDRSNHFYDTVSKENSVKSDGPCWLERGFVDSEDESVRSYSFIRGQNAPTDPNVLAERTTRRIKALELQNAIKAQVEERERLRKIELEKSLLEERRRDENLRQQIESSEQRFEEEQRKLRDKLEREQRKQEMMRIAIEKARQEAEIEKKKKRPVCLSPTECDGEEKEIEDAPESQEHLTESTKSMPPPKAGDSDTDNEEDIDDGEKFLIGTPIKMRKKTLNKSAKNSSVPKKNGSAVGEKVPTTESETNVDGIALVLQTLPPIMPILSNDIINLNQNINNLNTSNIQLAVMLAHQMQQLNNIAQTQTRSQIQLPDFIKTKMNPLEVGSEGESQGVSNIQTENEYEPSNTNEVCKQCTTGKEISLHDDTKDEIVADQLDPNTHSVDQTETKDAATVTDNYDEKLNESKQTKEITNDKLKNATLQVQDASTQTDTKLEYCIQCRYPHCHHHHLIVKNVSRNCVEDVKTLSINHATSKSKYLSKECASAINQTNCGDPKEPIKMEDRPKWGVNRPLHQYVKASERDPFYIRNKRKKHQKRQFTEDMNRVCNGDETKEYSIQGSRSTSPSPSIITNSTVTLNSPQLINRKRSICTEILPIKTDMNGRVYLNFDEASLHVTEVTEDKSSSRQRSQKNRMTNRNQTANEIRSMDTDITDGIEEEFTN